jgi:soluble cytochrome b562
MKIRTVLAWLAAIQFLPPVMLLADEPPATPAPAAAVPTPAVSTDTEKKTDLELRMDRISKAFRKLRKQVADPTQNASSLTLVSQMQAAVTEAADLTPEKADDVPPDQRAKFMDDYKAGIKGMQDEFAKLADALTAGRNDDAVKLVSDIAALEKQDHKDFRRPPKD